MRENLKYSRDKGWVDGSSLKRRYETERGRENNETSTLCGCQL